jgi:hypothetical protein
MPGTPTWGVSATSLAIADSVISFQDLHNGHIDYALALDLPHSWIRAGVVAWPAERSDGGFPPLTRMIALAAQRYGFIVRDGAARVVVDGQAPRSSAQNAAWQNSWPRVASNWNQVLQGFPGTDSRFSR